MTPQIISFSLKDATYESEKRVKGRVIIQDHGVFIEFEGFGTVHDCIPVMVEHVDGVPEVKVWADYKQEDPTHEITLEAAKLPRGAKK